MYTVCLRSYIVVQAGFLTERDDLRGLATLGALDDVEVVDNGRVASVMDSQSDALDVRISSTVTGV